MEESNWERAELAEQAELRLLCPTIDSFVTQIRDFRIGGLIVFGLFSACGIGIALTSEPPLLDRKIWFGIVIAAVSIVSLIFVILAPAYWIRRISTFFSSTSELDEVLQAECKSGFDLAYHVREFGLSYGIMLPVMLGGLWVWRNVDSAWGAVIVVPTAIVGVARVWYIGSRDAMKMMLLLEDALRERGYDSGESIGVMLLRATFVNSDNHFSVEKSWQCVFPGLTVNWCKYNGSGNSISSGIACVSGLYGLTHSEMASKLRPFSSVYFDEGTDSIYGTLMGATEGDHSHLGGVPWQYKNCSLVARFDSDLLKYMMKNEIVDKSYARGLVESWQLIVRELAEENHAFE